MTSDDAKVRLLHSACGTVTESDCNAGQRVEGIVIGSRSLSRPVPSVWPTVMGVEIRRYNIIYNS